MRRGNNDFCSSSEVNDETVELAGNEIFLIVPQIEMVPEVVCVPAVNHDDETQPQLGLFVTVRLQLIGAMQLTLASF